MSRRERKGREKKGSSAFFAVNSLFFVFSRNKKANAGALVGERLNLTQRILWRRIILNTEYSPVAHIRQAKGRLPLLAYRGIYLCYTVLMFSATPLDGALLLGGVAHARQAKACLPFFAYRGIYLCYTVLMFFSYALWAGRLVARGLGWRTYGRLKPAYRCWHTEAIIGATPC